MPAESLAAALARAGSPVELLRNLSFPPSTFPVKPEFTNWRSEQRSWVDTCALLDQSHHMTDLFISGPDALRLLSDVGVNTFANFGVGKAKQFVAVNPDGLPDRRRDPLPPRGGAVRPRRAPDGDRLGDLPPGARRLRRHGRARRQLGGADVGAAPALPVRAPGPHRRRDHRAGERRPAPRREVLQHGRVHHRRPPRPRAAARHGRPARLRAVRPLEGRGRRPLRRCSRPGRTTASCGSAPRPTRRPTWSPGGCRRR